MVADLDANYTLMDKILEIHMPVVDPAQNALDLLVEKTGFSRTQLKKIMANGAVWLQHKGRPRRLRRSGARLHTGDVLHLYFNAKVQQQAPKPAQLVADEGNFSVWDKPPGMYAQGSKWGDHCCLLRWAERQLQRPTFIVHRLDRAASGLMLVAHDRQAAARLSALFRQRQVEKAYRVKVHGHFSGEVVEVKTALDGKPSRSRFQLIEYLPDMDQSLLQVWIETGRKHQIRRHLSGLGFAVVGDRLYGCDDRQEDLQLRAVYLAFGDPRQVYSLD